jgi:hypothetical protein
MWRRHNRHLWRCAAFFKTPLQCHYQQSQRPTYASHRFTCGREGQYWVPNPNYCIVNHDTLTMSLSTVTTANWRFAPIHMREGKTILGAKSKILYSETALYRKPFGIGHISMLQAGRSRDRVPMMWIFFNLLNSSSRTMVLGSTQPLSTRNPPGG